MALSNVDMAMLNSIMYDKGLFDPGNEHAQGDTLGAILSEYDGEHDDSQQRVIDEVLSREDLRGLVLIDQDSYHERGSNAVCWKDPDDGRLYVVFQGTGTDDQASSIYGRGTNSEWYTDAAGLIQADTDPQIAAANYVEYIALREGSNVIVSGHSNGANKAMYCGVVSPYVDQAVAFDGQGFSKAFFDKYSDQIQSNCDKILFFGQEGDYVGPLLKPLPIYKTYIKHGELNTQRGVLENFGYNHSIDSMFTEQDGSLVFVVGTQSWASQEIERFMKHLYSTCSVEELETMAPFMGKVLDAFRGNGDYTIEELLNDPEYKDSRTAFLNALATYDGLDDLIASLIGALGNSAAPDKSAQAGFFSFESVLRFIRAGAIQLNPSVFAARTRRSALGFVEQYVMNVITGGAWGNRNAVRDFTDAKRQELLAIVQEVESEPWFDPTRWDVWYRGERWFGLLTIQNYQDDMNAYYRKTIDIDGVTAAQINSIFNQVEERSHQFSNGDVEGAFGDKARSIASNMRSCI